MEELFNKIIEFLLPQNDVFIYIFLFLSAIVENLFPPIPGDTITAFGAFLVGTGRLNYFLVYLSTTIGSVIGFMCLFFFGRYLGREFFMNKNYKFFKAESIESAEIWFNKYGYFIVLANRFLPGIRSVISLASGISRLGVIRVFLFSVLSASVWNLIWIHAGYLLGNNWEIVKEKIGSMIKNYNITAGILMAVIIILFIIFRIRKSGKIQDGKSV